jgi:hypothetical protein
VNLDVSADEWASGEVQLAVDADGNSLVPMPEGLLDEDDIRGVYDPEELERGEQNCMCCMHYASLIVARMLHAGVLNSLHNASILCLGTCCCTE